MKTVSFEWRCVAIRCPYARFVIENAPGPGGHLSCTKCHGQMQRGRVVGPKEFTYWFDNDTGSWLVFDPYGIAGPLPFPDEPGAEDFVNRWTRVAQSVKPQTVQVIDDLD